jgi:hypothetical protein
MKEHYLFYISLAFFLIHEMDAIRQKEWSMLPLISQLNNRTAYLVFTSIHIPFYGLLFYLMTINEPVREEFIHILNIFLIFHAGLHIAFKEHPNNNFKNNFSLIVIFVPGISSLLDLLI